MVAHLYLISISSLFHLYPISNSSHLNSTYLISFISSLGSLQEINSVTSNQFDMAADIQQRVINTLHQIREKTDKTFGLICARRYDSNSYEKILRVYAILDKMRDYLFGERLVGHGITSSSLSRSISPSTHSPVSPTSPTSPKSPQARSRLRNFHCALSSLSGKGHCSLLEV